MSVPLDHFCRYDELTAVLEALAREYPHLVTAGSIGQSHEGRELWLVTVTDASTGPHDEKPALWIDANIHATELTAGVAALSLLRRLVTGFGNDRVVTEALRTRTLYVMPRVNPDGVELALADRPRYLRSSVRPWPWSDRWAQPGLHRQDVDGDGRILSIRIPDSCGAWTTHPDDIRMMVPVPADGMTSGPRYRLLDEGLIEGFDGYTIGRPRPPEGLDLNRNFPAGWGTGVAGSGDYPGSEPEVQALVRAIAARPNICGTNAYHTFGGVLLRPSSTRPDSELPTRDVWTWKQLGERGTALSSYPVHSVYEDFTWDKSNTMSGAADDWAYEHLGVFSWTTEFWDPIHAATGSRAPTSIWEVAIDPEIELQMLHWFDAHHPDGYVDWYPFDHPQLGRVELGGWDSLRTWSNPPAALLEAEVAPHADFAVFQALCSPRLVIERVNVMALGEGAFRISAGIANTGYLPTQVSQWAANHALVRPLTAEIELSPGASLVEGSVSRIVLGQLEGYQDAQFSGANDGTPNRVLASWVVRSGSTVTATVTARHPRAGTARATVSLDE